MATYMISMGAQRTKHTMRLGRWPRPSDGYHHERSRCLVRVRARARVRG